MPAHLDEMDGRPYSNDRLMASNIYCSNPTTPCGATSKVYHRQYSHV